MPVEGKAAVEESGGMLCAERVAAGRAPAPRKVIAPQIVAGEVATDEKMVLQLAATEIVSAERALAAEAAGGAMLVFAEKGVAVNVAARRRLAVAQMIAGEGATDGMMALHLVVIEAVCADGLLAG